MVHRIIAVNVGKKQNEQILRDDLTLACAGNFDVTFESSINWWLDVRSGSIQLMSGDAPLATDDVYFFVRARRKESAFVALVCHLLALKEIPFSDNGNASHSDFTDKSFCIPRLAHFGLPVPHTIIVSYSSLKHNLAHIEDAIPYPCVVKGSGARGENIFLVEDRNGLLASVEVIRAKGLSLITIQVRIENSYDVRALFLFGACLGAMRRTRETHGFLNNVSAGATISSETLSEEEELLCRTACSVSHLDFCGVDFIRTSQGIVFLEINKSPQLVGIRRVIPELSVGDALVAFLKKTTDKG
jgi:hypothetical protein